MAVAGIALVVSTDPRMTAWAATPAIWGNVENVKRVVFVGNPNVGKSSMFNALLGARTRTMNAPGTTVSITCGQYHYEKPKTAGNAQNWQFVDTPGTYSLAPMSPMSRLPSTR